ncbi:MULTISPECIES: transglycosylase domain-containing protein [Streptomyces]|uniref:Transglycosylase domain-containing protein n=1 Tax=Streptomyces doudnae TaxID=3075536 RepID=A0ABD5EQJ7_9ACTN|nr:MULTISPECIES: transglycosylase domain-containing protein [unclassified Streptomyces]MDT0436951.1 transglycosylase domain-containing protein [Streptomyces sp. DSM 41981]MYQ63256.1 penicillin-binding protein [Streptomyces sp. SID4950]SCD54547.1 Membrane carboxypeptidase (penicillin-binding protein) [Streptomyces sp. SolWspMP-5a-2]
MSEHRRKPPQPQGGGRAAARRGQSGPSSGRRAAPRGATGSPSEYGLGQEPMDEERSYGGRAESRRASQRSGGSRRRAAEPARGGRRGAPPGGPGGPGRGRGRPGEPAKKRFIDYPRAGKYGAGRWLPSWKLVTGVFIAFFGGMIAVAGVGYALVGVPDIDKTASAQNNVFYWNDGSQMVSTGGEVNRQNINISQIPKEMQYAVISQENKTFETDGGVDPKGIARAFFNMARGGQTQGGSTITQQYVKNAMLNDQSQTISRKFKEILVSIKVGAKVPKDQIMAGYLNSAYYGRSAYGLQAASRAYFNKEAKNLDPGECAFLAATLKGATYYDPAGNPSIDPVNATREANTKRALSQMQDTLDKMVEYGHLDAQKRAEYTKLPKLENPRSNFALSGQIGYLVDLAKGYLVNNTDITTDDLQRGGYSIHTTFDKKKVKELETAVTKVQKANIKPEQRPKTDTHVQFGGASVDPATGAIRAIYGGEDATKHFTNNADVTGAQVGSTFKPFVLAAAMKWGVRDKSLGEEQAQDERTQVSPKSLFSGQDQLKIKKYDGTIWKNEEGKEWLQTNDGNQDYGTPPDYKIDLREAMRESVNSAFVQLGMDVGLDKVKEAAVDAGLKEDSLAGTSFPSFSIGISDPSAIRMAGAYATFAASGERRDPYSVKSVSDKDGTVFTHKDKTAQAFTSQVADNVTDVLKTVVEKGTGTNAQLSGREVAGKTGTTDGNKSAWFVGYTPQLSTSITMFRYDDDETQKNRTFLKMFGTGGQAKIHGASFPSEIWHDYMEQAMKGLPVEKFPTPEPIGEVVNADPTPTPTPTPTETEEESPSPSPTPTKSESSPPSPSPTESCRFGWQCNDDTGGTDDGGTDGGSSPSPTTSETESTTGTTRGNENGGLFGGPNG